MTATCGVTSSEYIWEAKKGGREKVAERTGLEPATPGVTGRYSNQLNYHSVMLGAVSYTHLTLPTNREV